MRRSLKLFSSRPFEVLLLASCCFIPRKCARSFRLASSIRGRLPDAKILRFYLSIDTNYGEVRACQTFLLSTRSGEVLHGESSDANAPRRPSSTTFAQWFRVCFLLPRWVVAMRQIPAWQTNLYCSAGLTFGMRKYITFVVGVAASHSWCLLINSISVFYNAAALS